MAMNETKQLMEFISASPSPFHAVAVLSKALEDGGYQALSETRRFKLEKGGKYYLTRSDSALIAFTVPKKLIKGYSIIASHTDSPALKLKQNPEVNAYGYTTLNVEAYGGLLLSPWFDRPLSLAGRVFIKTDEGIERKLVDLARPLVIIPSLAIHLNREANKGIDYKIQRELLPLFAEGFEKDSFKTLLAGQIECDVEDILDFDLFLYDKTSPAFFGKDNEFFSSGKIDDLACAYCSIRALLECETESEYINLVSLFDNEEVGSSSRVGALSDFLKCVTERIAFSLGFDEEERLILKENSFMLSADNGHALHPNYPEKSDIVNKCLLNKGVLIKYSANQKYTTDGESGAFVKNLCAENDIPYQCFLNNSDLPGGSTLGNLSERRFSVKCADVGLPQLSMHSPYETAGSKDTGSLIKLFKAFLSR